MFNVMVSLRGDDLTQQIRQHLWLAHEKERCRQMRHIQTYGLTLNYVTYSSALHRPFIQASYSSTILQTPASFAQKAETV
jgi:hypothetical protein